MVSLLLSEALRLRSEGLLSEVADGLMVLAMFSLTLEGGGRLLMSPARLLLLLAGGIVAPAFWFFLRNLASFSI